MDNKVYILLDRSGSMSSMWKEALGGINGYVKGLKNADVTLAAFDTLGYDVIRTARCDEWKDVTNEDVLPRGGTPLLDAAARIMHSAIDSKAKRAIVVVVTDGEENSSQKYNVTEVRNLTKMLTSELDYEMVFLGANFDKIDSVAHTNFGVRDMSRVVPVSSVSFTRTMTGATVGATMDYFNNGKSETFYNEAQVADAKKA